MSTPSVREGTRADRSTAAAVLGRAFQDEPVYRWLFPDPDRRRRALPAYLRRRLEHSHQVPGAVQLAVRADQVVGVAIWGDPGSAAPGPLRRALAWPEQVRTFRSFVVRAVRLGEALRAVHPAEPHRYLDLLGADPDVWRCGAGTALLTAGLAKADTRRIGVYLECRAGNLDYYRRFGFAVRDEVVVDPHGLTLFTMWRPPSRGGANFLP